MPNPLERLAEAKDSLKGLVNGSAPPPPKAYGLTLKRNPPETPEDSPEQSQCFKITMKCCLLPIAVCTWSVGKLLTMCIIIIGGCLYPCIGDAMLAMIFSSRSPEDAMENAKAAKGCLLCIFSVLKFSDEQLISPLGNLCVW